MRAGTFLATVAALLLSATVVHANPIATRLLRVRQVYETTHVQLTYAVFSGEDLKTPTEVQRDGVVIGAEWVTLSGSFTANAGSGLTGMDAVQFCDCSVQLGEHAYEVTVPGGSYSFAATVDVVDNLQPPEDLGDPLDAGDVEDEEVWPWEIPEPTHIQGLDCPTICGDEPAEPDVDAGGATDDAVLDSGRPDHDDTPDAGGGDDVAIVDAGEAPDAGGGDDVAIVDAGEAPDLDGPSFPDTAGSLVDSGGGSGGSGSGGVTPAGTTPEEDEDSGCSVVDRRGVGASALLLMGALVLGMRRSRS